MKGTILTGLLLLLAYPITWAQEFDKLQTIEVEAIHKQIDLLKDSLSRLNISSIELDTKLNQLDSLKGSIDQLETMRSRIDSLSQIQSTIYSSIGEWERKASVPIDRYNQAIGRLEEIANRPVGLNKLDIPLDYQLPTFTAPTLPEFDFELPSMNLSDLKSKISLDQFPEMPSYLSNLRSLAQGGSVPEGFLSQWKEVQELDRLRGESRQMEQFMELKNEISTLPNLEELEEKGKKAGREVVNEKLVEHSEKISQAQNQLAPAKSKFNSIKSIQKLPKRRPNEMKGKPLKERISPGLLLETRHGNLVRVLANPFISYRITGAITAGIGYTYQFEYDNTLRSLKLDLPSQGVNLFGQGSLKRGFIYYASYGRISAFNLHPDTQEIIKSWQNQWMIGTGKVFKLSDRLDGKSLVLYDLGSTHLGWRRNVHFQFGFTIKLTQPPTKRIRNQLLNKARSK